MKAGQLPALLSITIKTKNSALPHHGQAGFNNQQENMLNVNQKTMENYRVIKDTKNGRYYIVCAYQIELELIKPGMFEILKENDPTARQILEESSYKVPIADWKFLICESEHYLYRCTFRKAWYDWEVLKK